MLAGAGRPGPRLCHCYLIMFAARCACRGWPPRTPPLPLLFDYVCSKKWWELRGRAERVEINIAICDCVPGLAAPDPGPRPSNFGRAERVEIDIAICDGVPGLAAPNPALPISTKTARSAQIATTGHKSSAEYSEYWAVPVFHLQVWHEGGAVGHGRVSLSKLEDLILPF